jgi:hypothetical protein
MSVPPRGAPGILDILYMSGYRMLTKIKQDQMMLEDPVSVYPVLLVLKWEQKECQSCIMCLRHITMLYFGNVKSCPPYTAVVLPQPPFTKMQGWQ